MKNYVIAIMATSFFIFSACGAGDIGSSSYMNSKKQADESLVTIQEPEPEWSPDLDGLCACFEWRKYVDPSTKKETLANVIGAQKGVEYVANVADSKFDVELYYYDLDNLNEVANSYVDEIKTTGSFTLLGNSVPAFISNNNKYMMIYTDTSSKEENLKIRQQVIDLFVNFQ